MTGIQIEPKNFTKLLWIGGGIIFLDQLTKWVIMEMVTLHRTIPVIQGLFNITHVQNPGGAFGFLATQSDTVRAVIFLFVSSLALIVIFYFYLQTPEETHALLKAGFALIFGGAVGNLVDRVRFGKVIDFLDFYVGQYHYPAFNVADSAICVGVFIFILHVVFKKMPD